MAENSWPFYGVESTETQFSKLMRSFADSGVQSGLALSAGPGMAVSLAAGFAVVRGLAYENTSAKSLTVSAAPGTAGQTRLDAVVLKLDQDANTIVASVKAGTANTSGGALPALTQNETVWEFLLATIAVPNGAAAVTSGMINELRPSMGVRVLVNTSARKPTPAAAGVALFFNTGTKQIEFSDGTSWTSLFTTDVLTGTLPLTKGGTGATSASAARTALGAAPTSHTHPWADISGKPTTFVPSSHAHSAADITSGTLPVVRGGTGVTALKALREALDIYVQPTAPSHKKGRVWIPGTILD